MNTHAGYSKKTLTDTNVLLTGGGDKSLVDFLGGIQYVSASHKILIKTAAANASWTDLVTLITTDENVKLTPKTDNANRPLMMINGGTATGTLTSTSMFSVGIYANASTNTITSNGFIKAGSSSSYVLLGDGDHKAISDFATSSHTHAYLPLAGGTMSGDITFSKNWDSSWGNIGVTDSSTSERHTNGIRFTGFGDNAFIFYRGINSDHGQLIIGMGDDTGEEIAFGHVHYNGGGKLAIKSYIRMSDGAFVGNVIGNASTATNVTWSGITSKPAAIGDATHPVYWNGSGFTQADAYPTKASWNYNDLYVTAVGAGTGSYVNQLYYTKNGSNTYFTVPYASNADKLDGWDNTKFCKVYTRAEIGETPNFDNLKDVDGNQVNGFFESRVNETTGATGKKPPITSCVPMLSFLNQYVSLQLVGISGGYWYIRGAQGGNVANSNASTNWDRLVTNSGTWDISITGSSAKWTSPISMTIGNTSKNVDGSSDVSWSLSEIGAASSGHNHNSDYVTAVGLGSGGNSKKLYYTKNGSNTYFTVNYASSSYSSDISYFLSSRDNLTTASGILYIMGLIKTTTSGGVAYAGSSTDEALISFPAGSTSINDRGNTSSESANIGLVRIKCGSGKYMHEFHFSPNDNKFYHRSLLYNTASSWELIPVRVWDGTNVLLGSLTKPIYINSSGQFASCSDYPTIPATYDWTAITNKPASKTIWGLTYINSSSAFLDVNGMLTINCPDWDNDCGIRINEGGSTSYGFDILYGASDLFKIATRNNSTTGTNVITIARGSTNVTVVGNLTAAKLIKNGGTSSQFLKADGSVDSNTYALSSALSGYLPLSGGTMNNGKAIEFGSSSGGSIVNGTKANGTAYDGASYDNCNLLIKSWYGIGIFNTCAGDDRIDGISWYINVRYGNTYLKGNCTAVNFYTTSDRNKKQNISSFSEHIRKFQLKDTEKWHYGVIAQEVEEMFRDGEEGNMTVNYNSILSFYIGQLENKVKMLEERIKRLESK